MGELHKTEVRRLALEIGRHLGLSFYILGQRQGLGIGGLSQDRGTHAPWYVARKDLARNASSPYKGTTTPGGGVISAAQADPANPAAGH